MAGIFPPIDFWIKHIAGSFYESFYPPTSQLESKKTVLDRQVCRIRTSHRSMLLSQTGNTYWASTKWWTRLRQTKNKRAPDIERMELQENMHSLNKDSNPSLGGWCASYHFLLFASFVDVLGIYQHEYQLPWVWVCMSVSFRAKIDLRVDIPIQAQVQRMGFSWFLMNNKLYIPRTQLTSIFEGQPSKTRPLPIKTRVIWVLGIYITSSWNDECSYSRVQRFRQTFKQKYPSLKLLASPVACRMFLSVYCKIRIRSDQVYTWPFWKKTQCGPFNSQLTSNLFIFQASKKTQPENSASPAGQKKDKLLLI